MLLLLLLKSSCLSLGYSRLGHMLCCCNPRCLLLLLLHRKGELLLLRPNIAILSHMRKRAAGR